MKLLHLFAAAGIALAGLGAAVPADAQPGRGDRYEHRGERWGDRNDRHDRRRYDRHDRRRYDRRGRRASEYRRHRQSGYQRRCRPEWRNGRRIQICG